MEIDRFPARSLPFVPTAVLVACLAAACSGAGVPASSGATSASAPPSSSIATAEAAFAAVVAAQPEFDGIAPFDPDLIGACCWYTATAVDGGYEVVIRMGWGDCPAGCIEEHVWTYRVGADGRVELVGEGGDSIPPGGIPSG